METLQDDAVGGFQELPVGTMFGLVNNARLVPNKGSAMEMSQQGCTRSCAASWQKNAAHYPIDEKKCNG